ncbi:MAG TPA: phage protease, partial [Bacteroidota bacterium]|nr:phage protease [Bacteroidota bacterium]
QIKKDREAKIEAALKKAKDEGKITPAQEAHYKKLLESDYDTTTAVLEALPVNPATKKEQQKPEEGKPTIPASATLANAGLQSIREQIAKLTTISDN